MAAASKCVTTSVALFRTSSTSKAFRSAAFRAYIAAMTSPRMPSCSMSAFHWSFMPVLIRAIAVASSACRWAPTRAAAETAPTARTPTAPMAARRRPTVNRMTNLRATDDLVVVYRRKVR